MQSVFHNANEAFEFFNHWIRMYGENRKNGTRRLTNVGFKLMYPQSNTINSIPRNWNLTYAKREMTWYISENRSVKELKKFAPMWDKMHSGDNIVNSNYGFLWNENDQLDKVIDQLRFDDVTRQAWITIFDGKNKHEFAFDTPCTLSIGFEISNDNKLCMTVFMRSNDLWFGFCNDQYCFSELQKIVANELDLSIGWYYHFVNDLHLYNKHLKDEFKNLSH